MPTPENTERILTLLQNLRGTEPLRQLFWVELNYTRIDEPIEDIPESLADCLAEAPRRFAAGGRDNDFHIIYARLNTKTPRKTDERRLIAHLQTRFPHALYLFSNIAQDHWHFVNVKLVREERGERKARHLFRRITIAPDEKLRTAAERIAMLDLEALNTTGLFENVELLMPLEISNQHDIAFDVDAVTEQFFADYQRVFKRLQTEWETQTTDKKWAHDAAQQFLSRCLFLYFIQRKRWLGEDPDFLHTFWTAYQDVAQPADTFVDKWLNVLFFAAFNNRFHGGYRYFPDDIRAVLQHAPYLNGGLFRQNEWDTAYNTMMPDDLWREIFTFFEGYNFTIAEDTPLEQEVAVDPEMIGKVYESLVSVSAETDERGDAGIFYTPRIEIDLMCRLALVDNLTNHIGEEHKHELYAALFTFDEAEKAEADAQLAAQWQAIAAHLNRLTVLDPACGSGSFLVGMLHILDDLGERAARYLGAPATSRFERRKAIIGKNLYGVDVMPWACKVAELRLWLALIIETEIPAAELELRAEPLLPDFSFNIRHGDSLVQDIGGMNLAQTRTLGSGMPSDISRKIANLQTEKLKFYHNEPERTYREKADVQRAENALFRDILVAYETQLPKQIHSAQALLKALSAEQMTIAEIGKPAETQLDALTQKKQAELAQHEANLAQVQRVLGALKSNTAPPFVWDIAFVEIFSQDGGFDIVIENPPYVSTKKIAEPTLARDEVTLANKNAYKAKLARSVYQAFPEFFGYQPQKDTKENPAAAVKHKLDGNSDLYVYFYFHGLSLLNPRGTFCTITSKAWLDVGYGKDLQEFLLTQCHLKMVLDNAVKRSFGTADINTVICLISAPHKGRESNLQCTARFVNFKTQFEAVLDPVIFYEIETATEDIRRQEHRTFPLSQQTLLINGMDKKAKYAGDKWDGKYLRSPDIYWHILRGSSDKLVRVEDVVEKMPRGFTTGANAFFILDNETISRWKIEAEFLHPVIASPKNVKSLIVTPEHLPYHLLVCSKEKNALKGTSVLEYIEWGEKQGFHRRPSLQNNRRWYDVGERILPPLSFPRVIGSTAKTLYAPKGCYATSSFVELHLPTDLRVPLCASLNATLFQLMVNIGGRSGAGGGALVVANSELENLLCVNPNFIYVKGGIDESLLASEDWDVLSPSPARIAIDNLIFDILELSQGERDGVYEAVINLVETRLKKAKS